MDQVLTESSTKGSGQNLHYHLNTVQTIQFKGYFTVDLIVVDLWSLILKIAQRTLKITQTIQRNCLDMYNKLYLLICNLNKLMLMFLPWPLYLYFFYFIIP